jgi:hypothetical protein
MFVELLGSFIQTVGELFVVFTVLRVHRRVLDEKRIDREVMEEMKFEQFMGVLGGVLIIIGFLIHASDKLMLFFVNFV